MFGLQVLEAPLIAVLALMVSVWVVSLKARDASLVDRIWGLAFALVGVAYAWQFRPIDQRGLLTLGLVTLWGVRLSLHLHWRNRGKGEDHRYAAMRQRHRSSFWWRSLFFVFGLQGALVLAIAAPIYFAASSRGPESWTAFDVGGGVLALAGIVGEGLADWQLSSFRADPSRRGTVLAQGLWRFSRHPNYFCDAVFWWGIFVVASAVPYGWTTFPAPLLMTWLLVKVSGVALLDRHLAATRPGYAKYMAKTPGFAPFRNPFRRSANSAPETTTNT